jgi:hypothetical protein
MTDLRRNLVTEGVGKKSESRIQKSEDRTQNSEFRSQNGNPGYRETGGAGNSGFGLLNSGFFRRRSWPPGRTRRWPRVGREAGGNNYLAEILVGMMVDRIKAF